MTRRTRSALCTIRSSVAGRYLCARIGRPHLTLQSGLSPPLTCLAGVLDARCTWAISPGMSPGRCSRTTSVGQAQSFTLTLRRWDIYNQSPTRLSSARHHASHRSSPQSQADGRSRGFGTILFATTKDAARAIQMFNETNFGGRQVTAQRWRSMGCGCMVEPCS